MRKTYTTRCFGLIMALWIPLLFCLLPVAARAQTKRFILSGKVLDANTKQTIPGAVVKIQSTTFAIATNNEGNFNLTANIAPGTYQVTFSYIGFKTASKTVVLGTEENVKISAELTTDAVGLDEVIVTGTSQGTTRKQLGSYVSTVKGDDLNKAPSGNVLSSLQGKTAGAQISQNSGDPAGGMSVRLRGVSSVNSSCK